MSALLSFGKFVFNNTVGLPFTRPKTFMLAVVPAVATLATSATTGLGLSQAFGKVSGQAISSTFTALADAFPFLWETAVSSAPGALEATANWVDEFSDPLRNEL